MAVQIEKSSDPDWAWAEYEPDTVRPWNLAKAGHLYRRAAFGASWDQLQQALADGPQLTIEKLLRPQTDMTSFNRTYDGYETSAGSVDALRAWWLRRIIQTPHPLLEKMTLFWHSYFATNGAKVKSARLMQQHFQLLRSQALGSFQILLEGISRDPAVFIWLSADTNRKALPNENFVRPLLETFTLGPDKYTEKDVAEASRAFTGWFVLSDKLRYIPHEHDENIKRILGQEGNFKDNDVVRILLQQPATSNRVIHKLYRWLICETEQPDTNLIAPLVESFAKGYNVLRLVETMLRSNLFFSPATYRQRIKCPAEFAMGIIKGLEAVVSTTELGQDLAGLGQNLCYPPTVKGWAGGQHWITNATMIARYNLASALLSDSGPYAKKLNPSIVTQKHGFSTTEASEQFLLDLFLQGDIDPDVYNTMLKTAMEGIDNKNDKESRIRRFTQEIITLPEFHLA